MYKPPRTIPYPLKNQSGDEQLPIDETGVGGCASPVLFGNGEEPLPVLVVLTGKQWERIYSALLLGADVIYPNAREQVLFDFTKWWDCPLDICQIIQDCIGTQLEALQTSIDAVAANVTNIENNVTNINNSTTNSAAKPPISITYTNASFRCGGALALVDYMHAQNMAVYAQAEQSAVDNISETIIAVLSAIPALETLPVGAIGALSQSYFENQAVTYEADFALARIPMSSLLACMIEANGNALDYDTWGDWLESVEVEVPSNTASQIFARYSPARQTLINQIAALINAEQSLEAYFKQLFTAYSAGADNPSNACQSCPMELTYVWEFIDSDGGFVASGAGTGTWSLGQGWNMGQFISPPATSNYYVAAQISKTIPVTQIDTIEVDVSAVLGDDLGGRYVSSFVGSPADPTEIPTLAGVNTYTFDVSAQSPDSELYTLARASHSSTGYTGSGKIIAVRVTGMWSLDNLPSFTGGYWL